MILENVMMGDVWVCSGQSNMQWPMKSIFNSTYEMERIVQNYPNFKMFKLSRMTSAEPQDDLLQPGDGWRNDADMIEQFSAVCLLTASYMADVLGKDKVFGLIESNWGGTRIEAWMDKEALDSCDIEPNVDENRPQQSNSYLYNAMIRPLVRLPIKGVLWYQGEANTGWNRDKYRCTFPAMIEHWRQTWNELSGSQPDFPFGFMQLAANQANDNWPGTPVTRWHQTVDFGIVPNDLMKVHK